jgi:hypothetical protein
MKERWELVETEKFYFRSYELLMEVVEGYKLVKLFAPAVKKESSEVVETKM